MTPRQVDLVQSTWRYVAPKTDEVAKTYFGRLSQMNLASVQVLDVDAAEQGRDLMQRISEHVNSLTMLETVTPPVGAGAGRGRQAESTQSCGDSAEQALLWTLEQQLGPAYTDEVDRAWTSICESLAETLKMTAAAKV